MPKISELPSVTSIAGTETIPVVQSSTTKKATASQLKGYRSFVGLVNWNTLDEETELITLQNDDFTISFNRLSIGKYTLEDSSGPFLQNKTALFIMQDNNVGSAGNGLIHNFLFRSSDSLLKIDVYDADPADIEVSDYLTKVSFEIRVYP
jgi:hypothetical protein